MRTRVLITAALGFAALVLLPAFLTMLLFTLIAGGTLVCGVACYGCDELRTETCAVTAALLLMMAGLAVIVLMLARWLIVRRKQ